MAKFIECDLYSHPEHRDELYFIYGFCQHCCLNINTIKFFDSFELRITNYPHKDMIIDGTRLVLNDDTIKYVPIEYGRFKNMVMR